MSGEREYFYIGDRNKSTSGITVVLRALAVYGSLFLSMACSRLLILKFAFPMTQP